jgi:membrane protease YdiL (CAAX protease family)
MQPYVIPFLLVGIVYAAMVVLNETMGLFGDHFSSPVLKYAAYLWLAIFFFGVTFLVVASSMHVPTPKQLERIPFYSLFNLHLILIIFLVVWWLLAGRPPIARFLNIRTERAGEAVMTGFAVGVGGWIFTIIMALIIAFILVAAGVIPKNPKPSPMIFWMAALPLWKKAAIVLSAMTVEEAFFRGWLQKRIGLVVSTILFALAHVGLGQPTLLIGVFMISLVIAFTFYRTKNLIPGIIAHGVFDGVQLFVVIPTLVKMLPGLGG